MENMEVKQRFKLIQGNFSSDEAKNMLYDLIASKIQFHNKEALSIQVRTSGDVSHSTKRVEELKETRLKLEQLIDYADENNLILEIYGEIEIKLKKNTKSR